MDTLDDFIKARPPTAARPLLGLTVLLVEDSRYASEAFRLMCLRSGARIRRADTLAAATKHLRVYRPTAVIVDLGLPDGSGADLIKELANATPRVDVLLATSGDPEAEPITAAAGADGFLLKPVGGLAEFQSAILQHLPADRHPTGPRILPKDHVVPDEIALRDDLEHAASALSADSDAGTLRYVSQFLSGVARSAGDVDLGRAVEAFARDFDDGPGETGRDELAELVRTRLKQVAAF